MRSSSMAPAAPPKDRTPLRASWSSRTTRSWPCWWRTNFAERAPRS
jgi:hypothetical protein